MEITSEQWERIRRAIAFVLAGGADRVDGDGWKVYRVVQIVRIDLG